MAQVNWGDPQTFWLNATNAALGVVVLICCLVVAVSIVRELAERRRTRLRAMAEMDRELRDLVNSYELGVTMADGGEPIDQEKKAKP